MDLHTPRGLGRQVFLSLDDWGVSSLEGQAQHDLLEVIDGWSQNCSTLVASQVRRPSGTRFFEPSGRA